MTQATVIAPGSVNRVCAREAIASPVVRCVSSRVCQRQTRTRKRSQTTICAFALRPYFQTHKEDKAVVTHELEENLTFFPEVESDELELDAFPTEEIIDPYDLPHSEYEVGSIVRIIDEHEHHCEWGRNAVALPVVLRRSARTCCFEVIKVRQNLNLYKDTESYLNGSPWHYLLSSQDTAQKLDGVWVKENELCHFDESHLISTNDEIF